MKKELTVLRLYFSASDMLQHDSWWRRFMPQNLGAHLLQQARDCGVEQALLHRVIGGYLKNQQLVMDNTDIPPTKLPQCLELVGEEDLLQAFLKRNEDHLKHVRVMFLRGEEARIEAFLDNQELEESLNIERSEHLLD
jgi:PII-like signaling protein